MRRSVSYILIAALFLGAGFPFAARSNPGNEVAVQSISYLLSVDRLHFYSQNLADHLDGKKSPETIDALRSITPEDIYKLKLTSAELNNPEKWQTVIHNIVSIKSPSAAVSFADLEWNYNFFKNKLVDRFNIKGLKASKEKAPLLNSGEEAPKHRSVPKIKGQKYLLDVERYIAEKTSRAIIWDAILNDRDFELHIGTQREFQERVQRNRIQILGEVQPMARNYNKIYLSYNEQTGKYSYIINMISGDDRIKHLIAQLRLIRFDGKSYVTSNRDKVRVLGNANQFHKEQERKLLDIYNRLPKADKVVIGQKGAIDDAIRSAGMLEIISQNAPEVLQGLELEKTKKSKFENLTKNATEVSNFLLDAMNPGPVKLDTAYGLANDPFERVYKQFNSEQASHEFSDYLLLDKNNNVQRWRVISAVWGDEIVPIAEALKKSGHTDIVYIGTAGAINGKGIKVGDVIPGTFVQTHSGKTLSFSPGTLVENPQQRHFTVGQVHTPFDETDKWLHEKGSKMDIVEVETGYLREKLGPDVKLEAYFLVSDIVGSESETLAHAAQTSSKRKRGQLRLLENLFLQNGIKAPISNFEMIPGDVKLKTVLNKLTELRPSRDIYSLLQVAHLALRNGTTSAEQLEVLLKSQPTFDRRHIDFTLMSLGALLSEIQAKIPKSYQVGIISESLFNGTFNPLTQTKVKIMAEGLDVEEIKKALGESRWKMYEEGLKKHFALELVSFESGESLLAKRFKAKSPEDLFRLYEKEVLKKTGFSTEIDASGKYRLKEIPGMSGGLRCETIML